jgi:hypothetical protein
MGFLWVAVTDGLRVLGWSGQHPFAYFFFLGFLTSLLPLSLLLAISAIIPANAGNAMAHRLQAVLSLPTPAGLPTMAEQVV